MSKLQKLLCVFLVSLCISCNSFGETNFNSVKILSEYRIGDKLFLILCVNGVVYYHFGGQLVVGLNNHNRPLTCGRYSF